VNSKYRLLKRSRNCGKYIAYSIVSSVVFIKRKVGLLGRSSLSVYSVLEFLNRLTDFIILLSETWYTLFRIHKSVCMQEL
jgi:hypothetical protein